MDAKKKKHLKNILLYGGLVLVIAFTIITSIALNYKQRQLDDLKDKNEEIDKVLSDQSSNMLAQEFENFSKNLNNFIDNAKNI